MNLNLESNEHSMRRARIFKVLEHLDDEVFLGQISLSSGVLTVHSAPSDAWKSRLQHCVDEFNNRPFLVSKAPPSKSVERYALGAVEKRRGDEGFDDLLLAKFRSYGGLDLEEVMEN